MLLVWCRQLFVDMFLLIMNVLFLFGYLFRHTLTIHIFMGHAFIGYCILTVYGLDVSYQLTGNNMFHVPFNFHQGRTRRFAGGRS